MHLAKKIIIGLAALVVLFWVGAYIAVKVAFPPDKIKALVGGQASQALSREVSIGDASIGVFPNLKISLKDLRVANAPGFSPEPAFNIKELGLSVGVLSLLKFKPVINEILLNEPEILYEVDARGKNNLEGMFGPEDIEKPIDTAQVQSPVAIALKAFLIQDGRVRYRNLRDGQEIVLNRINQKASLNLDQKLENITSAGELVIREILISDKASGLKKGDIAISVRHDVTADLPGEKVKINLLEATFQDVKANLEGELRDFTKGPLWVDFRFGAPDIALASLLREIPAGVHPEIGNIAAEGTAALKGWVKGALDSVSVPAMQVHFELNNGAVSHKELGEGIRNLHVRVMATEDTLDLQDFGFELASNPVTMTALLSGLRDEFPMLDHFAVNADVDLGKMMPLLVKLGLAPEGPHLEGLVKSEIKAAGRLNPQDPSALDAIGEITLENMLVKDKSLAVPVSGKGRITLTDEIITEDLSLKIGESDVTLQGTLSHYLSLIFPEKAQGRVPQIKAKVVSENLNLDELLAGQEKKEAVDGPPMRSFPSLPKIDALLEMNLARTQFLDLTMTDFVSTTRLKDHVADTDLKGRLYTGGFSSRMRFDLQDTTDAKVNLVLKVDKVEANDFISRLNDKIPAGNRLAKTFSRMDSTLFGKFTLNADLSTHGLPHTFADNLVGTIYTLLGDGRIAETGLISSLSGALGKVNESLRFGELTFSHFDATLEAEKGRLLVKHAKFRDTPVGDLEALGSIGFDNTLALTLANFLPPSMSRKVTGATGALSSQVAQLSGVKALANLSVVPQDNQGRAILYYRIGGTLASPSFSLDANRMAQEAGGGVKNQLKDQARQQVDDLKNRAEEEKRKLEEQAKERAEAERAKLEEKAQAEKEKAADGAKDKAKKMLRGLGK